MKTAIRLAAFAVAAMALAMPAAAQIVPLPDGSGLLPPPPAPPPPPRIEVPVVPQMDDPPRRVRPAARPESFGDRVTRCLHEAAGLSPSERAAYSRACANQQ